MVIKTLADAEIVLRASHRVLVKKANQPIDNQLDKTFGDLVLTRFTEEAYPVQICEASAHELLRVLGITTPEGESSGE